MATSAVTRPRRAPARRGQGAALRADILDAASGMVARSGDASTLTLRAVAREVGVAATSIYLHFESVEALVEELKECRFGELTAHLQQAADAAGPDPLDRLLARARAYLRFGIERPGEYAVMFAAKFGPVEGRPSHAKYADAVFRDLAAELRAVPRAGRPPMDADEARMICYHVWTALHGMVSLRLLRPSMDWPDADAQADDLVHRLAGPRV